MNVKISQRSPVRQAGRGVVVALLIAVAVRAVADDAPTAPSGGLADLSLEELGNIEVTSVSKTSERLSEAAASIFVITADDIRRSGAMSIPEALRLAPNLEVARIDGSQYAISARGFDTTTTNKLLVLIDGRSVYTPLYSGVFWDAQDTMLEDIERIEVISGPGGTLWGSNAVNGVINVITRSARDTRGTLVTGTVGTESHVDLAVRHGGRLGENGSYRVYAKGFDRDATALADGSSAQDGLASRQLGFRLDGGSSASSYTLQGDHYDGSIDQPVTADDTTSGTNVLGRWRRSADDASSLQLQAYYDRTTRKYPDVGAETRDTLDLDVQHHLRPRGAHEILWGGGYRYSADDVEQGLTLAFLPKHRTLDLANLFVQDTIHLAHDRLDLTLGTKIEHNDYTGWEIQPSVRVGWKLRPHQLLWGALSRAVRTPSRIDRDLFTPPPPASVLAGGPDFQSEKLIAWELGWRLESSRVTFSTSSFYNTYGSLRTAELIPGTGVFVFANRMNGETFGLESWADIKVNTKWRLTLGHAYLEKRLRVEAGSTDTAGPRREGNDPRNRVILGSMFHLGRGVEIDATLRHVSALPEPDVPAWTALDLRLAWRPRSQVEISFVGTNLLDDRHPEFGDALTRHEVERSGAVKVTWSF